MGPVGIEKGPWWPPGGWLDCWGLVGACGSLSEQQSRERGYGRQRQGHCCLLLLLAGKAQRSFFFSGDGFDQFDELCFGGA